MAEEPNDLVLRLLRDMRGILDKHTLLHESHQRSFSELNRKIDDTRLDHIEKRLDLTDAPL